MCKKISMEDAMQDVKKYLNKRLDNVKKEVTEKVMTKLQKNHGLVFLSPNGFAQASEILAENGFVFLR